MLDKNRKVLSPSVPSLSWHKSFAPYQAGYVCLPSPSIYPCFSVPSQHTGTEDRNTLSEKLCQEENKSREMVKNQTNYAKRKTESYLLCLFLIARFQHSPVEIVLLGPWLYIHDLLDFAIKFSCMKKVTIMRTLLQ